MTIKSKSNFDASKVKKKLAEEQQKSIESGNYSEKRKNKPTGCFGIRSYLHQFYEPRASPTSSDIEDSGGTWYLLTPSGPPRRSNKSLFWCRMAFAAGMGLLVVGAVGILVGYLWPQPTYIPIEGKVGDRYVLLEPKGLMYADTLRLWKMAGLSVFAFGGLVVAFSLLLPTCCKGYWEANPSSESAQESIKIYPEIETSDTGVAGGGEKSYGGGSGTPVAVFPPEFKMPIMEEIKEVQPKDEEMEEKTRKMSKSGLLLEENLLM